MAGEKPGPSAGEPEERYVADDALWVVPSGNYVDSGPALEESLFDDPERLDRAWEITMETLRAEAEEPPERKQQIEEQARTFIDEAERAVEPLDEQFDRPGDAGQPLAEVAGERGIGLLGRVDHLVRSARRTLSGQTT
ncbi:hypothetical protein [Micromonospora sp. NPDC005806]|uniref:hypothetical protein n=1 Tax=Micromonospora sp. NPDC005806 TaxID=3364234 RepID=UPI0036BB4F9F